MKLEWDVKMYFKGNNNNKKESHFLMSAKMAFITQWVNNVTSETTSKAA